MKSKFLVGVPRGIVAEALRGKAVRRLVERNCNYRGKRPNRDRVEQGAILLNHATPRRDLPVLRHI
jgi:hypothetical protein